MINFQLLIESLPALFSGAIMTLKIAAASCLLGIILGTVLGILQSGKSSVVRALIMVYVTIMRGTPMLIQIYIVRYLLPQVGINVPMFFAAVLAIGLNSAAYVSQIIKLGIDAVSKGQKEAAKVLGFSDWQIMRFIVLPQAVRTVLPALGNELVTLVKDSSLASVIGVVELTKAGSLIRSVTYDVFTSFAAVGFIYLIITSLISVGVNYLERRMSYHAKN